MDYYLWDVIENGPTLLKTQVVEGVITMMPITSVEDKAQIRLKVRARSTLMMGIPNEHQLKFNCIKDAKQLMKAIKKRFGRNDVIKKTQRNLLKQQYENFIASNSEMLDQTFDRLQKLRNKSDLDTMSMDDLYNNLNVYEPEVKGIHLEDLEEMDLKWKMAMLTMRARRFFKKSGRKLNINGNETIGFDKTNVECYNCHKRGHFSRECRALRSQDTKHKESTRMIVPVETPTSTALVSCDGLGGYDWSDQAKEGPNYALMAFTSSTLESKSLGESLNWLKKEKDIIQLTLDKLENASKSLNKLIDCQIVDNCLDEFVDKPKVVEDYKAKLSKETPKQKAVVNAIQGNVVNAVKALTCWVWKPKTKVIDHVSKHNSVSITLKKFNYGNPQIDLQDKGVIDSGCSRNMIGNMLYLKYYKEIDEGYVAFGGNPKGGKITGKYTIRTGSRPDSLFNIDALIRTMNYEPIDADDGFQPLSIYGKKVDEDPRKESECKDQEQEDNVNSTNNVNATSTNRVNAVDENISNEPPFDPDMPESKDISIFLSDDHEDDGAEVDMNNMDTTI
nr:hypothetical protein [Tanacetum cinerariifolium]